MRLPNQPKVLAATYNPVSDTKMISFLVDFPTVYLAELRTHRILTQGSLYEHMEHVDFNMSANCLHPSTKITIEYNQNKLSGKKITIENLYKRFLENTTSNLFLRNLNEVTGKIQTVKLKNIWKTIPKQTYKIKLTDNSEIVCTDEHRIYSNKGYVTLKDLNLTETKSGILLWNNNDVEIATNGITYNSEFFIEQKDTGKSLTQICNEQGYNYRSAAYFCEKNRIFFRKKQIENEGSLYKNSEWLSDKLSKGMFSKEIATLSNTTIDKVKKQIRKFGLHGNKNSFNKKHDVWNTGKKYKIISTAGIAGHKTGALKRKKSYTDEQMTSIVEFKKRRKLFTSEYLKQLLETNNYDYRCPLTNLSSNFDVHHIIPIKNDKSKAFDKSNLIVINRAVHRWIHVNDLCEKLQEYIENNKDLSLFVANHNGLCKTKYTKFNDKINKCKKGLFAKYYKIESITKDDLIECFDIEVDGEFHNFVANNIIVHNSARAIPTDKYVQKIKDNPFVPIWTTKQKGMQGGQTSEEQDETATIAWNQFLNGKQTQLTVDHEQGKFDVDLTQPGLVDMHEFMVSQGIHKQQANRILAPFAYTTCIISGTEWDNFFELRCPKYDLNDPRFPEQVIPIFNSKKSAKKWLVEQQIAYDKTYGNVPLYEKPYSLAVDLDGYLNGHAGGVGWEDDDWNAVNKSGAQPEFQVIAEILYDLYQEAEWKESKYHIPFGDDIKTSQLGNDIMSYMMKNYAIFDRDIYFKLVMKISASMCAKLSYNTQENDDTFEKHLERAQLLIDSNHPEPFAHQAVAMNDVEFKAFAKRYIVKKDTDLTKLTRHNDIPTDEKDLNSNRIVTEYGWCYNLKGFMSQRYIIENL